MKKIVLLFFIIFTPSKILANESIPLTLNECLDKLEEKIEYSWDKSANAIKSDWQGDPQVNFIFKDGTVKQIEVLKKSANRKTDEAAIAAIKDAAQSENICLGFQKETFYIRAVFMYKDISLFLISADERRLPKNQYERISAINKRKWPQKIKKLVIEKKIQIGMTEEQVLLAWGEPDDINTFVGRSGKSEQWIYGNTYVYLDSGILSSWQEW